MRTNLAHYRKIFSDVDKRDIVSLYLLNGPESFIMDRMAMKIASSIVPEDLKAFNLTVAYGGEVDIDEFIAAASAFPFLSDQRVLILRELEKLKGSWKRIIAYCENPVPSSVVIFLCNPFDDSRGGSRSPRDLPKLESLVKRAGKVISFDRLTEGDLRVWVKQEAKRLGFELEADSAEALVQSAGENLFD
ncbi:MAG: DNA polymerase III subunit delta, partial [Candidatus Krumholzibacteria bacterium]|nr:DNA polymerase III subunit delta [Candidatus Krumholzibacteria bacterium]